MISKKLQIFFKRYLYRFNLFIFNYLKYLKQNILKCFFKFSLSLKNDQQMVQ